MPKFLIEATYTAEGLRGLAKDKASGRQAVVKEALASLGGKLEATYFALGDADVYVLCDCPDHVSAAALSRRLRHRSLCSRRILLRRR